jgi:very-short-patch-repair endonuclease
MDTSSPLPDPTKPPRVISRGRAHDLGFTDEAIDHRLATGRWQRILPHTLLTSDTLTSADRLTAAVVFAGEGALLSGDAALADLGLRSVRRPDTVLVLVPAGRQPRSVGWVQVRPSARPMRRALVPGPPRVEVARAVADASIGRRRQDDVRALVADAVRRGFCTIDDLADEVRHGPRRGSAFLREAVDEVGGGAWSAPEARAAKLLRAARVPKFEQNVTIFLPDGSEYIADFLWKDLRAILEIDSDAHHALAGDADGTSDKHIALETMNYSVVHRTPRLVVKRPEVFVRGIAAWLDARSRVVA